jgi:transmembrane sensor
MEKSHASKIEEQVAQWVSRQHENTWNDNDQAALSQWLEASTAHRVAFLRLAAIWKSADRLKALHQDSQNSHHSANDEWQASQAWWRNPKSMIAASLIGATVTMATLIGVNQYQSGDVYITPVGGSQTLALGDGTRIELNTDTKLRTIVNSKERTTWLEKGEAYFEVAKDAHRPFIVIAGEQRITVLGTHFSVRRDGDKVSVVVTEGRVRVDGPRNLNPTVNANTIAHATVELKYGDIALAQGHSILVKTQAPNKLLNELSWRHKTLVFDDTSLSEAAAEFNRYSQKKLIINDPSIAEMRIGGSFDPSNVEAFSQLLAKGFGLKIIVQDTTILISR